MQKAEINMEGFAQTIKNMSKEYPLVLTKLGSLELSEGHTDQCIGNCIKAINFMSQAKELNNDYSESTLMKTYELLCRAYELKGPNGKADLKNLGVVCGKVFNQTRNFYVFDQMLRIGLTGGILNLQSMKQGKLMEYLAVRDKRDRLVR